MEASVCGLFLLDKPEGITSHTAVRRVSRLLGAETAGHTGTLDPMATGVLPILVGRAVKASEYLTEEGKHYRARLLLGVETDTEDTSGTVLSRCEDIPSESRVREIAATFVGDILQTPPMYSAIRVNGKRLMELARRGETVERPSREIRIDSLSVTPVSDTEYDIDVACSKGTYIRTLCADIGRALGCGGTMAALRRTEAAGFTLDRTFTLEALEAMTENERQCTLISLENALNRYPRVTLPAFFARLARNGQRIYQKKIGASVPIGTRVRLYDGETFFALADAEMHEESPVLRPIKQFDLS